MTPKMEVTGDGLLCPRCGKAHDKLSAREFSVPVAPKEMAPFRWTHWAMCPTTNEPILIGGLEVSAP